MKTIQQVADPYIDTFSDSEMKSVFGSVLKPLRRVFGPNVSRYMVSVGSASTATLWRQLGLRLVKFVKRNQSTIIVVLCILGWFLAFSGWLA